MRLSTLCGLHRDTEQIVSIDSIGIDPSIHRRLCTAMHVTTFCTLFLPWAQKVLSPLILEISKIQLRFFSIKHGTKLGFFLLIFKVPGNTLHVL
jgi:hypothetical protein